MYSKPVRFFSVAVTTLIPWSVSLIVLETFLVFFRTIPLFIHYVLVVFCYGVTFFLYHKKHKGADPFTVMIFAVPSLLFFELIYFGFFYTGSFWFFTYFHWFVPLFLISSTIYGVGKLFQSTRM